LNETGNTDRTAASPPGNARAASAMNTPRARIVPVAAALQIAASCRDGRSPSLICVVNVPHRIIRHAMAIGATIGPHHGSGSRNRMSQSNSDLGHPHIRRRKT